jgi:DNA polymerase-3 subunit delta
MFIVPVHIPKLEKIIDGLNKGEPSNLFLIHGAEEYLIQQSRYRLIREFVAPGEEDFGLVRISVEKMSCAELLDIFRSPTLFASDRCYDLLDPPYFRTGIKDKGIDRLTDYLNGVTGGESRIIFSAGAKVDKRSRLYRTIKKHGVILEFPEFDIYKAGQINRDGMYPYVKSYLAGSQKSITPDAYRELRSRKENNLFSVIQELDKLIAYTSTKTGIALSDVETLVPAARSDQIYQLVDALLGRDLETATVLIEELIARGTPATHVVQLMARQYRSLLQAQQLLCNSPETVQSGQFAYTNFRDRVFPAWKDSYSSEIAAGLFPIMNNHPYVIFKLLTASELFTEYQLKQGLVILKEIDQRVKSTGGLPRHLMREIVYFFDRVSDESTT